MRIAIVNPLTLVGKELRALLHERSFPYSGLDLIDSMEHDKGTLSGLDDEAVFVSPATPEAFAGAELIFFCGPAEANRPWIERFQDEAFVIDLSQPSPASEDAVPVVAGYGDQGLSRGNVIISPHPVAIPIVLLLRQLAALAPVRLCAVTAIQPASEKGQPGIDELFQQTIHSLNLEQIPKDVFDRQLAFNMFPASDADEMEIYITEQVRSLTGASIPVSVSLTQGTTFHSHSFSIFLQVDGDVDEKSLSEAFEQSESFDLADPDDSYATIDAAGRDQLLIGRIRRDRSVTGAFWVWLVSDNVRRASALNAVLIAENIVAAEPETVN